ncbi:MAG: hypothetical protein NTW49_08790 [Bacteroidia bacterium]|nr:hypothetical protein [Bacteroidia bacterium]
MEIVIKIDDSADFDSDRPTTRSGIPVVTIGGKTVSEFLEGYFYPGKPPVALLIGGGEKEIGNPDLDVNLYWSVTEGSEPITSIDIDGQSIPVTGGSQTGTFAGRLVQDEDKTFLLTVTDKAGKTAQASVSVNWKQANYYGASFLTPVDLINRLTIKKDYAEELISDKHLASSKAENHDYNCTGGKYIYILYPASYGNPQSVKNGSFDFSSYTMTDVTITDEFGIIRAYKLFNTGYQTGSSVNINIIN